MKKSVNKSRPSSRVTAAKALPVSKTVAVKSVSVAASKAAPSPVAAAVAPVERRAIPLSATITVVATANPKRPDTKAAKKFPIYFALRDKAKATGGKFPVSALVAAFVAAGYAKRRAFSALRWDSERGFIKIEEAKAAKA